MNVIKVSAKSRTHAVAAAIAAFIREYKHAEVQAIGAGAMGQAMNALVLAVAYLERDGIYITCLPEIFDVTIGDKVSMAIKLVIDLW
jgi:stage V sporulation protein S